MRNAAGMPKGMRDRLFEKRGITPLMFSNFCEAEGIDVEDDPIAQLRKQPIAERLMVEIGACRELIADRFRGGVDNLTQVENWNVLGDLQGKADSAVTTQSGVGELSVQALNAICALLNLRRNGATGVITEAG